MEDVLSRLREIVREMRSVLVCYCGGVDSALVLAVAHAELGDEAIGITAVSPSFAPFEKKAAVAIAQQIGARHMLVESHEIDDPRYQKNDVDRITIVDTTHGPKLQACFDAEHFTDAWSRSMRP